ncbi:Uncharacterized protein QTN25_000164 [Entamoeba marina]
MSEQKLLQPPFPFEQLVDELSNELTIELLRDIVLYNDQIPLKPKQQMVLLKILLPYLKRFKPISSLHNAINCLIDDATIDFVLESPIFQTIVDSILTNTFSSCQLLHTLSTYDSITEEQYFELMPLLPGIPYDVPSLCYLLDALYHIYTYHNITTLPIFPCITATSDVAVLLRLCNILLISPSRDYAQLLQSIVEINTDIDVLVRTIRIYRSQIYDLKPILQCSKRIDDQRVIAEIAGVLNIVGDDERRRVESITAGGLRWILEVLPKAGMQAARGIYGYIVTLCYDAFAVEQLSVDPSWVLLFAENLLSNVTDEGCLISGFEVVSLIYKTLPEEGVVIQKIAECCVKALFAAAKSVENSLIVLATTINMSVSAGFCLHLLEWNLEEALDRILLSGNERLVERGCALLMNIVIDPDAAELLCEHYILLVVDVIEKYHDTPISTKAMGCVAAFADSPHGREIFHQSELFVWVKKILQHCTLDSYLDKTLIAITSFTQSDEDIKSLFDSQIVEGVAHVILTYNDEDILEKALNLIAALARHTDWHDDLIHSGAAHAVVRAVILSQHYPAAEAKSLAALVNLSSVSDTRDNIYMEGALDAVIYIVNKYKDDDEIIKLGFGALANLVLSLEAKEQVRENGFLAQIRPFLVVPREQIAYLKIVNFLFCAVHKSPLNKKLVKKQVKDVLKKMNVHYGDIPQFKEKIEVILKK